MLCLSSFQLLILDVALGLQLAELLLLLQQGEHLPAHRVGGREVPLRFQVLYQQLALLYRGLEGVRLPALLHLCELATGGLDGLVHLLRLLVVLGLAHARSAQRLAEPGADSEP